MDLNTFLNRLFPNAGFAQASEWWRMPLIGLLVSVPISLTTSLFLATYGADGPYGGFWRLLLAGLAASVPIFALSGVFFAPLEIWLTHRRQRPSARYAGVLRSGFLALAGVIGAFVGYGVVVWALPAQPPSPLLPVMLVTYPMDTAIVGLAYTLYDEYVYQLRVSTELTQEMRVARHIQQGLFPRQYPPMVGYRLAARCEPARETGGDFFDFLELQDGRVGVIIGDVAGKGMPAALLMADVRSIWRAEARLGHGPGDTLRRVNSSLCRDINSNGFITCLYATIDTQSDRVCFASAGHPLPLLRRDAQVEEIEVYGLPLGLDPNARYGEADLQLTPGDTVMLYTDGITESVNAAREFYGFERLADLLKQSGTRSPEDLVEDAWSATSSFSHRVGQVDDVTVIVLQRVVDQAPPARDAPQSRAT